MGHAALSACRPGDVGGQGDRGGPPDPGDPAGPAAQSGAGRDESQVAKTSLLATR